APAPRAAHAQRGRSLAHHGGPLARPRPRGRAPRPPSPPPRRSRPDTLETPRALAPLAGRGLGERPDGGLPRHIVPRAPAAEGRCAPAALANSARFVALRAACLLLHRGGGRGAST